MVKKSRQKHQGVKSINDHKTGGQYMTNPNNAFVASLLSQGTMKWKVKNSCFPTKYANPTCFKDVWVAAPPLKQKIREGYISSPSICIYILLDIGRKTSLFPADFAHHPSARLHQGAMVFHKWSKASSGWALQDLKIRSWLDVPLASNSGKWRLYKNPEAKHVTWSWWWLFYWEKLV